MRKAATARVVAARRIQASMERARARAVAARRIRAAMARARARAVVARRKSQDVKRQPKSYCNGLFGF